MISTNDRAGGCGVNQSQSKLDSLNPSELFAYIATISVNNLEK